MTGRTRLLLLALFITASLGLTACESAGPPTVHVGVSVHGGYGYGPGWGWGGGYHPGYPIGPYW